MNIDDFFPVAVNRTYQGKMSKTASRLEWARFNDACVPTRLDMNQLVREIVAGHAFTAVCKGRRKRENFVVAQHIGLDFDTEDDRSRLDTLQANPLIGQWGAFLYTSSSHTPAKPRG